MADFGGFPVFGADGSLLGNTTGNFGQVPSLESPLPALNPVPSLPSAFAPTATSAGAGVVTSQGSAGGSAGSIGAASQAPATAASAAQPAPASAVASGSLADYFLRGVIIILGFIFVAIGINMFRPGTVPNPLHAVRG